MVGASAAILSSLYGDGAVSVDDVTVTGATPTKVTADREDVVIQVSQGSATVAERTETVTLVPVKAGAGC